MNVRLDILAWLLVPLAVTVLAVLWVNWRSRDRGPIDAHEAMADLERFREAMTKPMPEGRTRRAARQDRELAQRSDRGAA